MYGSMQSASRKPAISDGWHIQQSGERKDRPNRIVRQQASCLTRLLKMGLEHWDSERRKFVLYRSDQEHASDCARFPFERIPRNIFLDTNIINILVKYSAHVFEHESIPLDTEPTLATDIEALMHVFYIGSRANWDIQASPKTVKELMDTTDEVLRSELVEYAVGFINREVNADDHRFAGDFARRISDSTFLAALPDIADRELVGYAIGLGCDTFCTCDRATIVKKRKRLIRMPLRIMTPAEWWAHVKPWAGLWG
ncbi:MAG: hypothetical protein AB7H90_02510 [Alphaproteobacteria bacterium]